MVWKNEKLPAWNHLGDQHGKCEQIKTLTPFSNTKTAKRCRDVIWKLRFHSAVAVSAQLDIGKMISKL